MLFKKGVTLITWVNVITVGWFTGTVLLILLSSMFDLFGIENQQFITGLSFGLGVSCAEWLALRLYGVSFRWIILGSLGMAIPFLFVSMTGFEFPEKYEFAVLPVMIGFGAIITGITQYGLLKNKDTSMGKVIQYTLLAWLIPVLMVNGASAIPHDVLPKLVLFLINLLAILGAGPVYAIIKFQMIKPVLEETRE